MEYNKNKSLMKTLTNNTKGNIFAIVVAAILIGAIVLITLFSGCTQNSTCPTYTDVPEYRKYKMRK